MRVLALTLAVMVAMVVASPTEFHRLEARENNPCAGRCVDDAEFCCWGFEYDSCCDSAFATGVSDPAF